MCIAPLTIKVPCDVLSGGLTVFEHMQVPCGKCYQCRSARARQWQFRMQIEAEHAVRSYFITLTYSDYYLPKDLSLHKEDVQKFFKRFRKYYKEKIKYFACGEYGDQFGRPHYHCIIYFYRDFHISFLDYLLGKSWTLGNYVIGTCTNESIGYVTKYMVKQWKKDWRTKPFQLMSKRPFIGSDFITPEKEIYYNTPEVLPLYKDFYNNDVALPRIYKLKMICANKAVELKSVYKDLMRKRKMLLQEMTPMDFEYFHWRNAIKETETKTRKK